MTDGTVTSDIVLRRRTVLALAVAAKEIHQFAAQLIPVYRDEQPGDLIDGVRQLRALDNRYRALTVIHARVVERASWPVIGERMRIATETAIALYEDIERRWRAGDPAPWVAWRNGRPAPGLTAGPIDIPAEAVSAVAAELDAYVRRTTPAANDTLP